jgi:RHS repeat-associated protein
MNIKLGISTFLTCALLLATVGRAEADRSSLATQISTKRVFSSPIEWFGEQEPTEAESAELLRAIATFETGGAKAGMAALENFVAAQPQSAWTPSVHAHLAAESLSRGRYSLALLHWEAAWKAMRESKDDRGQKLAVEAIAGRVRLLAALGQKDKLEGVLKELDAQQLPLHSQATVVAAVRVRLATMKARPGDAYRCGLLALKDFAKALGQDGELKRRAPQVASPEGGFNLAQLAGLAETNGIQVVAVRRPPGAELVVPCLVHWRQNHYAAILEKQGDSYRVSDPSFGGQLSIDREVIEAEASGAFLLPQNRVPADWQRLTALEAGGIQGSGYPNGFTDDDDDPPDDCGTSDDSDANCDPPSANDGAGGDPPPPPCCGGSDSGSDSSDLLKGDDSTIYVDRKKGDDPSGAGADGSIRIIGMPQWRVSEPYITLWLHDKPLRYRQSNGKWMQLTLNYKHRGQDLGGQIGGFGPKWYCNWLALLQSKSQGQTLDVITNYLAGGGIQRFETNGAVDYKTMRAAGAATPVGGVAVEPISSVLPAAPTSDSSGGSKFPLGQFKPIGAASGTECYVPIIVHPPAPFLPGGSGAGLAATPAGSQSRYELCVGDLTGGTNYFLTHRMDRYGRTLLFNYQTNSALVRLASIVDQDGRTNRLYYTNATFSNLITSVVSPYGQTARFKYDNLGRLTNIVDAAGLPSSFQYDSNDDITNMTTPYGQTAFQSVAGTSTRYADSQRRALLVTEANGQRQLYAYCDSGPDGVAGDGFPGYRNSYHWNRAQYEVISEQGKANIVDMPDADYQLAQTKHWLHNGTIWDPLTVSDTLNAMAGPLDPASQQRSGLMSFTYQEQEWAAFVGSLKRVKQIWGPNGNMIIDITRNSLGRPLEVTHYTDDNYTPWALYVNVYDASGSFLQTQTGPRGEQVRGYGYHPVLTNLLTSVTNALGDVIRYTHDTNTMKVTSITFPGGLVRTNIYYTSGASKGFLWKQIDLGVQTNCFAYQNGNLQAKTNELGLVTTYLWDNLDRLVSTAFPDGSTVSNLYNKLDLVGRKDRLGHWTCYGYNAIRQLTAATNANSQVAQYEYCSCGSPTLITNWNGSRAVFTQHSYDIAGRLTNTLYADGYQVGRAYDNRDLLTDVIDSGGRHAQVQYVQLGLRYAVAAAYMVSDQNEYQQLELNAFDEYGRVIRSTDANGIVVTNGYDFLGRLLGRQVFSTYGLQYGLPDTGLESFVYDNRGLTNYFDALGHPTVFVRDTASRVLYQTNANGEVLRSTYNPAGEILTLTDGKLDTTTWHYDQYGRVTNKLDAAQTEVFRCQYDPAGRLTNRWTAAKGNTGYGYDAVGNLLSIHYPLSTINYSYDSLNRLTNMTDSIGATAFAWTDGGQLAGEDGPWNADAVSYTYNNRLRSALSLVQPNASPWVQSHVYDSFARLTSITSPAGAFLYDYGTQGTFDLVYSLMYPSGAHSDRTHDGVGRLTGIALVDPVSNVLDQHGYSYDLGSQRTQQVFSAFNYANNANYSHYTDYSYDNIGQLKKARGWEPDGQGGQTPRLHEQFGYAYDAAWNLNYRTNNALVQTFGVNNLNELTTAGRSGTLTVAGTAGERRGSSQSDPGVTGVTVSGTGLSSGAAELYADGAWARAGATPANGQNSYTATAQDTYGRTSQDSVTVNLPASASYSYDSNGNLLNDGRRYFEYDWENQLTNVYVTGQWRSEFTYDGFMRRRVRKEYTWSGSAWVKTNEVRYVYDGKLVVQEREGNNLPQVSYTRGKDLSGSREGAGGIGGLLARTDLSTINSSLSTSYYHSDGNGNVTCLINTNSGIVARYTYDPFGNTLAASGPLAEANLYRYSTKEYHANSGLAYYLYRFYDPNVQRWINRDPIEEQGGANLYCFVANDPSDLMDTYGLQCCLVEIPPIILEPPPVVPRLLPLPRPLQPPCGLRPNPFRPGSWGRLGQGGKPFKELWRLDKGKPGAPGWRGIDHIHLNGEKTHLPIETPYWQGPGGLYYHNAPPVTVPVPPGTKTPPGLVPPPSSDGVWC